MGKYSKFERKKPKSRYTIHPIWAGIGFLMIIIVPIISWAAATELVNLARQQHWGFLGSFPVYLQLPFNIPGISAITSIQNLPVIGTFFLIILFVLISVLSFVYAMIYRVIGPPRYSPEDEPAPRIKTKKYTR